MRALAPPLQTGKEERDEDTQKTSERVGRPCLVGRSAGEVSKLGPAG